MGGALCSWPQKCSGTNSFVGAVSLWATRHIGGECRSHTALIVSARALLRAPSLSLGLLHRSMGPQRLSLPHDTGSINLHQGPRSKPEASSKTQEAESELPSGCVHTSSFAGLCQIPGGPKWVNSARFPSKWLKDKGMRAARHGRWLKDPPSLPQRSIDHKPRLGAARSANLPNHKRATLRQHPSLMPAPWAEMSEGAWTTT